MVDEDQGGDDRGSRGIVAPAEVRRLLAKQGEVGLDFPFLPPPSIDVFYDIG